jgi:hypothetical protein
VAKKFSELAPHEVQGTVFNRMVPVVDTLRDLLTKPFGMRAYKVVLVWTRWSGGRRGDGVEEVLREEVLLPTPALRLNGVRVTAEMIGAHENGQVIVQEISPRYTEAQLTGCDETGEPVPEDQNFYWELVPIVPPGVAAPRRRFLLAAPPDRNNENFEWVVKLVRAANDRTLTGDPEG